MSYAKLIRIYHHLVVGIYAWLYWYSANGSINGLSTVRILLCVQTICVLRLTRVYMYTHILSMHSVYHTCLIMYKIYVCTTTLVLYACTWLDYLASRWHHRVCMGELWLYFISNINICSSRSFFTNQLLNNCLQNRENYTVAKQVLRYNVPFR